MTLNMKIRILLFFPLLLSSCSYCPLSTKESVRKSLIKTTPLGSSRSDVVHHMKKRYKSEYEQWGWDSSYGPTKRERQREIGAFYICTHRYNLLAPENFMASWIFDKHDTLEDVKVETISDGP